MRMRRRNEARRGLRTGHLQRMRTPAVNLDRVYCRSQYNENRVFCPRSIYAWWQEVWLERVSEDATQKTRETGV
jgi:hypothetical protein